MARSPTPPKPVKHAKPVKPVKRAKPMLFLKWTLINEGPVAPVNRLIEESGSGPGSGPGPAVEEASGLGSAVEEASGLGEPEPQLDSDTIEDVVTDWITTNTGREISDLDPKRVTELLKVYREGDDYNEYQVIPYLDEEKKKVIEWIKQTFTDKKIPLTEGDLKQVGDKVMFFLITNHPPSLWESKLSDHGAVDIVDSEINRAKEFYILMETRRHKMPDGTDSRYPISFGRKVVINWIQQKSKAEKIDLTDDNLERIVDEAVNQFSEHRHQRITWKSKLTENTDGIAEYILSEIQKSGVEQAAATEGATYEVVNWIRQKSKAEKIYLTDDNFKQIVDEVIDWFEEIPPENWLSILQEGDANGDHSMAEDILSDIQKLGRNQERGQDVIDFIQQQQFTNAGINLTEDKLKQIVDDVIDWFDGEIPENWLSTLDAGYIEEQIKEQVVTDWIKVECTEEGIELTEADRRLIVYNAISELEEIPPKEWLSTLSGMSVEQIRDAAEAEAGAEAVEPEAEAVDPEAPAEVDDV